MYTYFTKDFAHVSCDTVFSWTLVVLELYDHTVQFINGDGPDIYFKLMYLFRF